MHWFPIAGIQIGMTAINIPGAEGGHCMSFVAIGFCCGMAASSLVAGMFALLDPR